MKVKKQQIGQSAVEMRADELQREVPQMSRAVAMRQAARQIEQGSAVKDAYVPRKLQTALESLRSTTQNDCSDHLFDDVPANYQGAMAAIAECREILSQIEYSMRDELEKLASWHRERLANIEAMELPPFESEATS